MAEVTKINYTNFELQDYNVKDENLITTFDINTLFTTSSCIEFYVLDLNKNVLYSKYDYTNYQVTNDGQSAQTNKVSKFQINPGEDVIGQGFANGEYVAYYNFLNKEIGNYNSTLYISEISSDRQEIRLDSQFITPLNLVEKTEDFIDFRENSNYFVDFYLNFGNNNLIIANNIKIENENTNNPTILIKLYEPLPNQFQIKDEAWVVTSFNEPEAYSVVNRVASSFTTPTPLLQGPNFSIPLKDQVNNSSQNLSYTDIISSAPTSSQDQIDSLLSQSSINISVDYNNFNDFIHFSSAETRIENFYYKVGQIQNFTSQSNALTNVTGSSTSQLIFEKKIANVIKNFDKFEYFMYYSSGSAISYPKSSTEPPYTLMSTGSAEVLTWLGSTNENNANFGGQLLSASNYDNSNPDQLLKSIPEYLREDPSNKPYDLFVDMVAQYYDNIWLYTKNITQKYNADNRLDFGVSKDLVSDAIKDFGVKLYQNNFSNKELYTAFLGMTPEGSLFPFPEITGSLPAPTGFEFVDTLISASNDVISMDDTNKSLYKRIYHNIPYLLKSKGTLAGLRALITSYGIPDTILKISEFGGKDQVNANDYDLYFNNFNYALGVGPNTNFISSSWEVNSSWGATNNRPSTVQLRFKSEEFPPSNLSQSLWFADDFGDPAVLVLDYSGSGLTSGSYDGSIKDPNYQVANLKLIPYTDSPNESASISLPFYNGDWWSVMITTNQNGTYNLYAGNKIYNGNDGTSIGYYASASITGATNDYWINSTRSSFTQQNTSPSFTSYKPFSGSLQEIRYYNTQISESVFKDYIMNPLSFEGNGINSAPDQLIFRAALGSELDINTSSSIHPKVTGSWATTSSFASNSNFHFSGSPQYSKNTEYFFLDQPAVGIKNRITDKIRSENDTLASGSVLSPIRKLSQTTEASASYTDNINYLEVAFSPQNQINDDIIGQLGHFNIGDYIGNPAQRFTGNNYPDLNNLSKDYFKKYLKQYDLVDFVRLIKFFDNSLFKMIKDFIPARTSLASGLVIKQHLLERNKYPQPPVSYSNESELTGSIQVESFNGGAAGMFNPFNISYDLDYFSGSETTFYSVSASSADGLGPNSGDTFISASDGPPITNASSLSFFSSFVPNLYVQLNQSGGPLNPFSFNSGSEPGLTTIVSGSFTTSGVSSSPNQINVNSISSNSSENLAFTGFDNGFIISTPAIFNNPDGNVLTNSSSISSIDNVSVFSTFPTQSIFTNVSASGRFDTSVDNNTTNFLQQNTNVNGGIFSNFNDFAVSSFVSASSDIFLNPSGSLLIVSGSGEATHNGGELQLIFTTTNQQTNSPTANPLLFFDNNYVTVTDSSTLSPVNLFNDGTVEGTSTSEINSILSSTQFDTTYTINTNLSEPPTNIRFSFRSGSAGGSTSFNFYSEENSDKSMITDIQSTNLSTEFVTSSIFTNVSASGTITFNTAVGNELRFNLIGNSNVSGGDMANFQEFKNGGYITTTNPIFSGSGTNSQIASASVFTLGSGLGGFRINPGQLSPVITPVSGSGNLNFFIGTSTATTMSVLPNSPNDTNVTGGKLYNFQEFANAGYITTTNPIFSGSGVNNQVNSASISAITNLSGFSLLNINAVTSSILTNVSMSGNFDFNSAIPADRLLLNSSQFNASDRGFFDNTTSYISASDDGSQGAEYTLPFVDNFGGVTNIAPINSTNLASYLTIDTSGGFSRNPVAYNLTFNFTIISDNTDPSSTSFISASARPTISGEPFQIRSGSISQGTSGPIIFSSSSIRTSVTNEPFTFRTGSITQGTAGSTTFISSSARNVSGTPFTIFSGSYDNLQTFTSVGTTYVSESARNIVGTSFVIHSGSLNNDLGISFTSESIKPQSHSRAQVASIGADDVIDFASNWSINNVGELGGTELELFDSLTGGSNIFASSSTQVTFRYNQLNQTPTPIFDITQSYDIITPSISGSVTRMHNSQDEFYNGELSGSVILATNGELNEGCEPFKEVNPFLADYKVRVYFDTISGFTEGKFLQNNNLPIDGYIQIFYGDEPGSPLAPILPETSTD